MKINHLIFLLFFFLNYVMVPGDFSLISMAFGKAKQSKNKDGEPEVSLPKKKEYKYQPEDNLEREDVMLYPDDEEIYAIQNKKYKMNFEIALEGGFAPLDAFQKGLTMGGGLTYYLNDVFGLQLVDGLYSKSMETGLYNRLVNEFGITVDKFEVFKWLVTSNLVYIPFYGKSIFFNSGVIHNMAFFILGGGVVKTSEAFRPCVDAGAGIRIFFSENLSLKFAATDYIYFKGANPQNILNLMVGFSFNISN